MNTNLVVLHGSFHVSGKPFLLDTVHFYWHHLNKKNIKYFNGRIDFFHLGYKFSVTRKGTFKIYVTNTVSICIYEFLNHQLRKTLQSLARSLSFKITEVRCNICNVHLSGNFSHLKKRLLQVVQSRVKKFEHELNEVHIYDSSGLSSRISASKFVKEKTILFTSIVLKGKKGGTLKVQITGNYTLILKSLSNIEFWKDFIGLIKMNFSVLSLINPIVEYIFKSYVDNNTYFQNLIDIKKIKWLPHPDIKSVWEKDLIAQCVQSFPLLKGFLTLSPNKRITAYNFPSITYVKPVLRYLSDYLRINIEVVSDNPEQCFCFLQTENKYRAPHLFKFKIEKNSLTDVKEREHSKDKLPFSSYTADFLMPSMKDEKKSKEDDDYWDQASKELDYLLESGSNVDESNVLSLDKPVLSKKSFTIEENMLETGVTATPQPPLLEPEIPVLEPEKHVKSNVSCDKTLYDKSLESMVDLDESEDLLHTVISDELAAKILIKDDLDAFKDIPGLVKSKLKLSLHLIVCMLCHLKKLTDTVVVPAGKCSLCPEHCLDVMKKSATLPRGRKRKKNES